MRNRNRIGSALCLVLFSAVLFGGCKTNLGTLPDETLSGTAEADTSASEKTTEYNESTETIPEISNLSEEFLTILNESPSTFYEGYAIDESFLLWLDASYGDDVIRTLADKVGQQETDSEGWFVETGKSIHVLWAEYCRDLGYATYQLADVEWKDAASEEEIVIDLVGDINFDEDWYTMQHLAECENGIDDCISAEIQEELQSADITLINNEFTYSTGGAPLSGKRYTFRTNPENVQLLELFGTDIVSLANNHVYDYGQEALQDTLDVLEEAQIPYVGAGRNLKEAKGIRYYIINGRKIAFVSATQIEKSYNYTKEATDDAAGVLKTLNPEKFLEVISKADKNSDYVIAYVHWGTEGTLYPDESQKQLAEKYAQAGADVIIGNHPHRLQGAGYTDGVPVIYSLGNFWFSTGKIYTAIAQVRISDTGELSVAMLPCLQENLEVSMIEDPDMREDFYHYIADLSDNVGIDADGVFHEGVETAEYTYESGVHYRNHSRAYDLDGRKIDIVGNLQE